MWPPNGLGGRACSSERMAYSETCAKNGYRRLIFDSSSSLCTWWRGFRPAIGCLTLRPQWLPICGFLTVGNVLLWAGWRPTKRAADWTGTGQGRPPIWMGGGGVRGGKVIGATDPAHGTESESALSPMHASILYLMGWIARSWTYAFRGREPADRCRGADGAGEEAARLRARVIRRARLRWAARRWRGAEEQAQRSGRRRRGWQTRPRRWRDGRRPRRR